MSRPDRAGEVRAMKEALGGAGLEPQAIGYINAHGTATVVGDTVEAEAGDAVFGDLSGEAAGRVSSTKSLHGHLLGGARALAIAVVLLALEHGIVAPIAHPDQPDSA